MLAAFGCPQELRGSPIFYSDFYKFSSESSKILFRRCPEESSGYSEDAQKIPEQPLRRIPSTRTQPLNPPHNSPKSLQKIFSNFWDTYTRCTSRRNPTPSATPGTIPNLTRSEKTARERHGLDLQWGSPDTRL